jgi:hypothetical protein
MNRSLKTSGQTSADCSDVAVEMPADSRSALGRAFTSVRRFLATQPVSPSPLFTEICWITSASTPVAKRHRSVSLSSLCRNSAQHENGTRLLSLDEISAIVSATPRLVPIAWAISYNA